MFVLYPDSNAIAAAARVGEGIHKRLVERFSRPTIQMFNEFLELSRFPDEAYRARVLRYLGEKYADRRPDVLVAVGSDALRAAIEVRSLLATTAPIVFCCASPVTLATVERPADVTGIVTDFDVSKTVALAHRLQPNTRPLVVIAGAAPFDPRWLEIARAHLDADHRFDARYLVGLPSEAIGAQTGDLMTRMLEEGISVTSHHALADIGMVGSINGSTRRRCNLLNVTRNVVTTLAVLRVREKKDDGVAWQLANFVKECLAGATVRCFSRPTGGTRFEVQFATNA